MTAPTRSLAWKLALAFMLVALTVALLVGVLLRLASPGQLARLVVEQQRREFHSLVADYYAANGGWQGVWDYVQDQRRGPFGLGGGHGPGGGGHGQGEGQNGRGGWNGPPADRRELFGLADADGRVLVPLLPAYSVGAQVPDSVLREGEPVEVAGETVGTILTGRLSPGLMPEEVAYLRRTSLALAVAGLVAVVVALPVGVLLARTLTRPLRALTQAAHRMAGGALEQQVPVQSADELGELAAAFNQMSQAVARANQARRQMTADVAHELRTPLTVIAGYVEAMREGVLPPTPERLAVIDTEIEHLQRLVDDLRTLAQADSGELVLHRQPVEPAELLRQAAAAFEPQAAQRGVSLAVSASPQTPPVLADETRLAQVLSNLVSNALRHTPAGGRVTLEAATEGAPPGAQVTLTVRDTGEGIAPEHLPYVFDRLYRGDLSRSEDGGHSGLGLAIARALVEAHGGRLDVASTVGEGSAFTIYLPAATSTVG